MSGYQPANNEQVGFCRVHGYFIKGFEYCPYCGKFLETITYHRPVTSIQNSWDLRQATINSAQLFDLMKNGWEPFQCNGEVVSLRRKQNVVA